MQNGNEYRLKDNWQARSQSRNSAVAEALNALAMQLNNAEVITGGTCRPTQFGLRIEVDSTQYAAPFDCVSFSTDKFIIRGEGVEHVIRRGGISDEFFWVGTWTGFTASGTNYEITTAITATTFVWLEINRTEAFDVWEVKSGTSLPDGSSSTYDTIEVYPLWKFVWSSETESISYALDLRQHYLLPTMA